MTEYPHSEVPSSNVSDFDKFRAAHHHEGEISIPNPEAEVSSDSVFAARLLDAWAQLPEECSVHEHILYDAEDDERLSSLITDDSLVEHGATLHFAGDAFATTMKSYNVSPEKVHALEIMYRLHFMYQRTGQSQPVRHPMAGVLFERIINESTHRPSL